MHNMGAQHGYVRNMMLCCAALVGIGAVPMPGTQPRPGLGNARSGFDDARQRHAILCGSARRQHIARSTTYYYSKHYPSANCNVNVNRIWLYRVT